MSASPPANQNPPLARTEVTPTAQELWKRYHRKADSRTENALVEQYLPLVVTVLGRLAMTLPEHVDRDDLRSAGLVGLLQALRNYDPACGTSFETYARVRIRGAMLDELRRMDWVPRTVHEKARKIQTVMNRLEQQYGGPPSEEQVAKAMGVTITAYREMLDEVRPAAFICLDAVASTDNSSGGTLSEVVPDTSEEGPAEQASQQELKQIVLSRLKELPEIQRKVLALYYGEDLHLREIAEAFGLTESRICQIHSQAILALRAYLQRFESGLAAKALPQKS
ncbi:MAG TPA: FliA/WhiG family RNA polymerase sigma factor [Dongiaceae bacterium]|jgi:RNA polymerase sigma factor for flagellar operon FliA|nr:FliA/WhiG family RNA polymerase sigma factor [Dongiaceae bacterium]